MLRKNCKFVVFLLEFFYKEMIFDFEIICVIQSSISIYRHSHAQRGGLAPSRLFLGENGTIFNEDGAKKFQC